MRRINLLVYLSHNPRLDEEAELAPDRVDLRIEKPGDLAHEI